jgi:hypothetical protein
MDIKHEKEVLYKVVKFHDSQDRVTAPWAWRNWYIVFMSKTFMIHR